MGKHSAQSEPVGRNSNIQVIEFEFELSASAFRAFAALGDVAQWPIDEHPKILVRKEPTRVILSFADASRVTLNISSTGADLCKVSVLHDLIESADQVETWQGYWQARVTFLTERFGE
jgi:hypothetical protein